jgi:hypothetical protein
VYKTSQQADKARAIWQEAIALTDLDICCTALDAGDNAAATLLDAGKDFRDQNGVQTDEFVYWWEQSLISILSDSCDTPAHAYFAKRGITA